MNYNGLVICVGELLIDFFCTDVDVDLVSGNNFLKKAGGAPANVAAAIAKLGGKAAFIGKVGDDPFGHYLEEVLLQENVDTSLLSKDPNIRTTLAFVSLKADGERDFVFSRGADEYLSMDDIPISTFLKGSIVHFGSATALLGGQSKSTYFSLMKIAKENKRFISFDPNYRQNLWGDRTEEFIHLSLQAIAQADFIKVSEEELSLLSNTSSISEGVKFLHELGGKVIAVTLGEKGTFLSTGTHQELIPSIKINSIDSTGAGDAFVGATLFQLGLHENPIRILSDFDHMKEIIYFANKVGAYVCQHIGAITALPTINYII